MKILFLSNTGFIIYKFRKELIQALQIQDYKVYTAFSMKDPINTRSITENLELLNCETIDTPIDRRGINPIKDLFLLLNYNRIISKIKPDVVLSYTIKPNLYAGLVCRFKRIKFIPNVTGLGTAFEKSTSLKSFVLFLYKICFKKASCVFFQNEENQKFLVNKNVISGQSVLLPGSGVNIDEFKLLEYPPDSAIEFSFISRIMKEKGIDQYLEAAEYIRKVHPNTVFHVCGYCEEEYKDILARYHDDGIIIYHGLVEDVKKVLEFTHCVILPSYHEGMSNVLLESASCGRPTIATDVQGCREAVDDGVTGLLCEVKSTSSLIESIEKFISIDYEMKIKMGLANREKAKLDFDRKKVVEEYLHQINNNHNN